MHMWDHFPAIILIHVFTEQHSSSVKSYGTHNPLLLFTLVVLMLL